jgi:hypothetical protein
LTKLDVEVVPHSELVKIAIGHCDGDGILLADSQRLGHRIPGRAAVVVGSEDLNIVVLILILIVVLILALIVVLVLAILFVLLAILAVELPGEEFYIAEVSRWAACVELLHPE